MNSLKIAEKIVGALVTIESFDPKNDMHVSVAWERMNEILNSEFEYIDIEHYLGARQGRYVKIIAYPEMRKEIKRYLDLFRAITGIEFGYIN